MKKRVMLKKSIELAGAILLEYFNLHINILKRKSVRSARNPCIGGIERRILNLKKSISNNIITKIVLVYFLFNSSGTIT